MLAKSVLDAQGHVLGVIPSVMATEPSGHPTTQQQGNAPAVSNEGSGQSQISPAQVDQQARMETRVVSTMHERKALMAKESLRGFVGLPGGYGTFEEVLEMVTWSQLGIHNVPIVLPNILGFWSPLQQLVKSASQSGFITSKGLELLYFVEAEEVQQQHGGDWGAATVAALEQMSKRLEGRSGYWSWKSPSSAVKQVDFSSQPAAIEVSKLTYSFQPHLPASLIDVNLDLPKTSRTLLIGANGAGKSTLLRLLAGKRLVSTSPDHTPVKVFGKDVFNSPPGGITYLGTEWAMNPVVRSDIRVEDFLNSVGGYRYKERRDRLLDLLDVDLEWHMHAISDGERRRVQLCMGLMAPWTVLLLDEVTVDLDVQVRSDLLAFLKEETEQRDATIVYATHIFDGLHDFPSHVVHMRLGSIIPEGSGQGTDKQALRWPPTSADVDRLQGTNSSASGGERKDGVLLNIALTWLRTDRAIREAEERAAYEAQGGTGRKRGARRGLEGAMEVETDSEKFYTKYDYSQTATR